MVAIRRLERVLSIQDIKPNPRNPRVHSNRQIDQIADSIKAFGFGAPVLVDETLTLIAGHGRLRAAELLGIKEIPAIELRGLSAAQKRALALADNKMATMPAGIVNSLPSSCLSLLSCSSKTDWTSALRAFLRPNSISCRLTSKMTPRIRTTRSIRAGKRARRSVSAAVFGFSVSTACFAGILAASPIWIAS